MPIYQGRSRWSGRSGHGRTGFGPEQKNFQMYSNLLQVPNRLIFKSSIVLSTRLFLCATRILVHDMPRALRIIFMSW